MTAIYEESGVSFQYPENWTLSDEETRQWPRTVTLNSPTGAFWSLAIYPFASDIDEILSAIVETMREDYPKLETSTAEEKIGEVDSTGIDIDFCCLDLVIETHIRTFDLGGLRYVILYQGEDHDFREFHPVFQAMAANLVANGMGE